MSDLKMRSIVISFGFIILQITYKEVNTTSAKVEFGICRELVKDAGVSLCCRTEHMGGAGVDISYKSDEKSSPYTVSSHDFGHISCVKQNTSHYVRHVPYYVTCFFLKDRPTYVYKINVPINQQSNFLSANWTCKSYVGSSSFELTPAAAVDKFEKIIYVARGDNVDEKINHLVWPLKWSRQNHQGKRTNITGQSDRINASGDPQSKIAWIKINNVTHDDAGLYILDSSESQAYIIVVKDVPIPTIVYRNASASLTTDNILSLTLMCRATSQSSGYLSFLPTIHFEWLYPDTSDFYNLDDSYTVTKTTDDDSTVTVSGVNCSKSYLPWLGCSAYETIVQHKGEMQKLSNTSWMDPLNLCALTKKYSGSITKKDSYTVTEKYTDSVTKKDSDSVTKKDSYTVTEKYTDSVTKKDSDYVTEKYTDSITKKDSDSVTEKNSDAITEKYTGSITKKDSDSFTKKDSDSVTKMDLDFITKNDSGSVTEKYSDYITKKDSDSITKKDSGSITEKNSDYITEKYTDYITKKYSDYITEKYTDYINKKYSDYITKKDSDSVTEKYSDSITKKDSYSINEENSDYTTGEYSETSTTTTTTGHSVGFIIMIAILTSMAVFVGLFICVYKLRHAAQRDRRRSSVEGLILEDNYADECERIDNAYNNDFFRLPNAGLCSEDNYADECERIDNVYNNDYFRFPNAGTRYPGRGNRYPERGNRYPGRGNRDPERRTRDPERGTRYSERGNRDPERGTRYSERRNRDPERRNRDPERGHSRLVDIIQTAPLVAPPNIGTHQVDIQFALEAKHELNTLHDTLKHPAITMHVHRNDIVNDVMHFYENMDQSNAECSVTTKFVGEEGLDAGGVSKDMYSSFWPKAKELYFKGSIACVPVRDLRSDKIQTFVTLGRIFAHSTAYLNTIPLQICRSTLNVIVFGEMEMTDDNADVIIDDFLNYLDQDDRDVLKQALIGFDQMTADQRTTLGHIFANFEMSSIPRKETIRTDLSSIAHNELCVKPRELCEQMRKGIPMVHQEAFWGQMSIRHITGLYADFSPTGSKVIDKLRCEIWPLRSGSSETRVFDHLKRFIVDMSPELLLDFLQFVTAERKIPVENISVVFTDLTGFARRPVARTCFYRLELPRSYTTYEDLNNEFTAILTSDVGMQMNMA